MKPSLALVLLAALAVVTAGCGAAKKIVVNVSTDSLAAKIANDYTGTITVTGSTATIPNVKTGTRITCKGWPGRAFKVPPRGSAANVGQGEATVNGTAPSSSWQMQLTHLEDGSVTVSCTQSH